MTLPSEILVDLMTYLDRLALVRAGRVNKEWQVAANADKLWKSLYSGLLTQNGMTGEANDSTISWKEACRLLLMRLAKLNDIG